MKKVRVDELKIDMKGIMASTVRSDRNGKFIGEQLKSTLGKFSYTITMGRDHFYFGYIFILPNLLPITELFSRL